MQLNKYSHFPLSSIEDGLYTTAWALCFASDAVSWRYLHKEMPVYLLISTPPQSYGIFCRMNSQLLVCQTSPVAFMEGTVTDSLQGDPGKM